jgi:hypothetical protein
MIYFRTLLILALLLVSGCFPAREIDVRLASRSNNVCKSLKGNVVVYAIFVDSKYTKPWTVYDIHSTMDSLKLAMNWIMDKAAVDSISLNIRIDCHRDAKGTIPIYNDLSKKTFSATLYKTPQFSGVKDIYRWADKIAAEAGKSLPKDTSILVKTPNNADNRERLIARLRDIHKTDNIALMYFINNYYMNEVSAAFDVNSEQNIEFAVVSFKRPAVISHEFLHLFGAWDLYITPFDRKNEEKKRKKQAMELFPNEIMAFSYRSIDSLEIGNFTKYSIGWRNDLERKYSDLILGKKLLPLVY